MSITLELDDEVVNRLPLAPGERERHMHAGHTEIERAVAVEPAGRVVAE